MYHIGQKIDILVVAMQKFSLATIFIQQVNDFILISDIKYELNRTSLSYKKITIRFCCFCSTATVCLPNLAFNQPNNLMSLTLSLLFVF